MATTSKEGSRRENFPIRILFILEKVTTNTNAEWRNLFSNWNEYNLNPLIRNNLRTSLVPAPAVIPAQRKSVKIVVVKKLVV